MSKKQEAPRWCALKVRVDCPECGSALFVDGPYKKALCTACGTRTAVTNLWPTLLDRTMERGSGGPHFRQLTFVWAGNLIPQIWYGANKGSPPICSTCDQVIEGAEQIADGTEGTLFCPGCGTEHATWPAPGYLSQKRLPGGKRAKQVFLAPPEEQQGTPSPTPADVKPILFGCLNCGANLRITGDTPRVLTCEFCQTDCFLPPEIWNRLHPVRKRRAFWIRLG